VIEGGLPICLRTFADGIERFMQDLLLSCSLRYTILALITGITLAALLLSYQGMLEIFAEDYRTAGIKLGWGLGSAIAALLLIRYRGDLIDD
jgi:ABC-type Fe3+-siderophore transport system permease subunit